MIATAQAGTERKTSEICILADGRRVRYSLQKRDRDPVYRVCFTGADGKRKELSTKERSRKRANDSAAVVIRDDYAPQTAGYRPTWQDAIDKMKRAMEGKNLRPRTIGRYVDTLTVFREWTNVESPADVTAEHGEQFKVDRLDQGKSPATVSSDLNSLRVIYRRWWIKTLGMLTVNPFATVEPPKRDRSKKRIVADAERKAFLDWLNVRWNNWRVPVLFLEVKAKIGCRITELASATPASLRDGRIYFAAETTKGRRERGCKLPDAMFRELQQIADTEFVFGKFSDQLRAIHLRKNRPQAARNVAAFKPKSLVHWLQGEKTLFVEKTKCRPFKLHNFRGTAMSRARQAGIGYDDAAIGFGCHPETMRQHYVALDEQRIADDVMSRI